MAGFPLLRFEPALETEYRESYIALNSRRFRAATLIGLLAVFGFIGLDQFLGLNLQDSKSDWLLMLVTAPAILVPLAATFRPEAGSYLMSLVFGGVMLMGMSIVAVIYYGRLNNAWFPSESLLLVTAYIYFVSGLMFYQAIWCGLLVWVAFLATNWNLQTHDRLLYEAYYLAVCNGLGMIGLYLLQHQARFTWLMQNELRRQAVLDALTGLMNRRAFAAHLDTAWAQAQRSLAPVGIMLIDIDGFKRINDTCGHQFGDVALQRVASQLKATGLRPLDAAARYGGDEFIAIWYGVDGGWLQKLTQEFPKRLEALSTGNTAEEIKVRVSGGAVVAWPRPSLTARDAIREADRKLYEMKRAAPGTIAFVVLQPPEKEEQRAA